MSGATPTHQVGAGQYKGIQIDVPISCCIRSLVSSCVKRELACLAGLCPHLEGGGGGEERGGRGRGGWLGLALNNRDLIRMLRFTRNDSDLLVMTGAYSE